MENSSSKTIVDDLSLYGRTEEKLIEYFRTVLELMKHHHTTIKIKKRK